MTSIALAAGPAHQTKADALVIGVAIGPNNRPILAPGAHDVDTAFSRRLLANLTSLGATGAGGECHRLASLGATTAPVVVAVGLGAAPPRGRQFEAETVRRAAGVALRSLAG